MELKNGNQKKKSKRDFDTKKMKIIKITQFLSVLN